MKINFQKGLFTFFMIILLNLMLPFVFGDVIITEIMYAPNTSLQGDDSDLEWIELFNNGTASVDLSSWQLEENDFDDVNISPGEFIVVARELIDGPDPDLNSFEAYYGNNDSVWNSLDGNYQAVDGNFGSGLLNSGEIINLSDGTITKFTVDYTQFANLGLAKNNGKTLSFFKGNFIESAFVNGTPGASNDQFTPVINSWTWNNTVTTSSTNTNPMVAENKTLSFKLVASDPNNDPINFTWFINGTQVSIIQNFTFDLTKNFTAAGNYIIKLLVQDNNSNSANQEWQVTVTNVNKTNEAPNITSTPITTATAGVNYNYDVQASDPDGDVLIFSLTTFPSGMSIDSAIGIISWTPSTSQLGNHDVNVIVSDGSLTDTQNFSISVSKGAKLIIKDLDVKVDGKSDKNLRNNTRIRKEAVPGSTIEFKFEIENKFTREEDLEIEDIEIQVTIEDIDDGDDLEEESNKFDLNHGKDKTVTVILNIPLLVDEGDYDVIIDIEGEDKNGTEHNIRFELELEVEKDKHDLSIRRLSLIPSFVGCSRTTLLDTEVINLGRDEEEDIRVEIINFDLGLNYVQKNIELQDGDDDETIFDKTLNIRISEDQLPGTYPIIVNAYIDDDELQDSRTVELSVQDCVSKFDEVFLGDDGDIIEVIRPPSSIDDKSSVTEITLLGKSNGYLGLLFVIFILLAIILIVVLGTAFYKYRSR